MASSGVICRSKRPEIVPGELCRKIGDDGGDGLDCLDLGASLNEDILYITYIIAPAVATLATTELTETRVSNFDMAGIPREG